MTYYYDKSSGGTRLRGEPGTPEFARSLSEARLNAPRPVPQPKTGAFEYLYGKFQDSVEYKRLSSASKTDWRNGMKTVIEELGWVTLPALEDRSIRQEIFEMRDRLASKPSKTDRAIACITRLGNWAYDRALIKSNNINNIERVYRPGQRAGIVWEDHHFAAFEQHADPDLLRAITFLRWTGMRVGDAITMRWEQHFIDGCIRFQPSKTKVRTNTWVSLPVGPLPPLAEFVRRHRADAGPMITRLDAPWLYDTLHSRFEAIRTSHLGEVDLHLHDLRGTLASLLAEAGATTPEIASVTGHALGQSSAEKILSQYLKRTSNLSENAFKKLAVHLRELENKKAAMGQKVPHLQLVGK